MSLRTTFRHCAAASLLAASLAVAAPALAQTAVDAEGRVFGNTVTDPLPDWRRAPTGSQTRLPPMPAGPGADDDGYGSGERAGWEAAKADWLSECRRRYGGRGGVTGGVIGGLVGGVAGSAIAGRGNRTVGGIVGGVAGAAAGAAIGSSADRRRASDYCSDYLDRHLASYAPGAAYAPAFASVQPGYAYAMQPVMVMVPVSMVPAAPAYAGRQPCTQTEIIEEWVPATRAARRYVPRRTLPDKRVRLR